MSATNKIKKRGHLVHQKPATSSGDSLVFGQYIAVASNDDLQSHNATLFGKPYTAVRASELRDLVGQVLKVRFSSHNAKFPILAIQEVLAGKYDSFSTAYISFIGATDHHAGDLDTLDGATKDTVTAYKELMRQYSKEDLTPSSASKTKFAGDKIEFMTEWILLCLEIVGQGSSDDLILSQILGFFDFMYEHVIFSEHTDARGWGFGKAEQEKSVKNSSKMKSLLECWGKFLDIAKVMEYMHRPAIIETAHHPNGKVFRFKFFVFRAVMYSFMDGSFGTGPYFDNKFLMAKSVVTYVGLPPVSAENPAPSAPRDLQDLPIYPKCYLAPELQFLVRHWCYAQHWEKISGERREIDAKPVEDLSQYVQQLSESGKLNATIEDEVWSEEVSQRRTTQETLERNIAAVNAALPVFTDTLDDPEASTSAATKSSATAGQADSAAELLAARESRRQDAFRLLESVKDHVARDAVLLIMMKGVGLLYLDAHEACLQKAVNNNHEWSNLFHNQLCRSLLKGILPNPNDAAAVFDREKASLLLKFCQELIQCDLLEQVYDKDELEQFKQYVLDFEEAFKRKRDPVGSNFPPSPAKKKRKTSHGALSPVSGPQLSTVSQGEVNVASDISPTQEMSEEETTRDYEALDSIAATNGEIMSTLLSTLVRTVPVEVPRRELRQPNSNVPIEFGKLTNGLLGTQSTDDAFFSGLRYWSAVGDPDVRAVINDYISDDDLKTFPLPRTPSEMALAGCLFALHHFKIIRNIASGAFGTVVKAFINAGLLGCVFVNTVVAIKFEVFQSTELERFTQAIVEGCAVQHEGIAKVLAYFPAWASYVAGGPKYANFIVMALVQEYGDHTLAQHIERLHEEYLKDVDLTVSDKMEYLEEIVQIWIHLLKVVAFMKSHGLSHRDIKPDNVVLVKGIWKLVDFGIVKRIPDLVSKMTDYQGSGFYQPPTKGNKSENHDEWSVMVTVLEMLLDDERIFGATLTSYSSSQFLALLEEKWGSEHEIKAILERIATVMVEMATVKGDFDCTIPASEALPNVEKILEYISSQLPSED